MERSTSKNITFLYLFDIVLLIMYLYLFAMVVLTAFFKVTAVITERIK